VAPLTEIISTMYWLDAAPWVDVVHRRPRGTVIWN
jgi:hypothetical protein